MKIQGKINLEHDVWFDLSAIFYDVLTSLMDAKVKELTETLQATVSFEEKMKMAKKVSSLYETEVLGVLRTAQMKFFGNIDTTPNDKLSGEND